MEGTNSSAIEGGGHLGAVIPSPPCSDGKELSVLMTPRRADTPG